MKWSEITTSIADLFMPRHCAVCSRVLSYGEEHICVECLTDVPLTRLHRVKFNTVEQLFAGKVPVERASGIFYYSKNSPYDNILYDTKYHNVPDLARYVAQTFSLELAGDGFFTGIDAIVPIPLHRLKHAARGYNQSEHVARGFSNTSGIPVLNAIVATREHSTQTRKGAFERWQNTRGIFSLAPGAAEAIEGKHILVVDDVITTGATIESAISTMLPVPGTRFSVLTLAVAHHW